VEYNQSNNIINNQTNDVEYNQSNDVKYNQSNDVEYNQSNNIINNQTNDVEYNQSNDVKYNQSNDVEYNQSNNIINNQTNDVEYNQSNDVEYKQSNDVEYNQSNNIINNQTNNIINNQTNDIKYNQSSDVPELNHIINKFQTSEMKTKALISRLRASDITINNIIFIYPKLHLKNDIPIERFNELVDKINFILHNDNKTECMSNTMECINNNNNNNNINDNDDNINDNNRQCINNYINININNNNNMNNNNNNNNNDINNNNNINTNNLNNNNINDNKKCINNYIYNNQSINNSTIKNSLSNLQILRKIIQQNPNLKLKHKKQLLKEKQSPKDNQSKESFLIQFIYNKFIKTTNIQFRNSIKNYFNKNENKFEIKNIFRKIDYSYENKFEVNEIENDNKNNDDNINSDKVDNNNIINNINNIINNDNINCDDKINIDNNYNNNDKKLVINNYYSNTDKLKSLSFKILTYNLTLISNDEIISILSSKNHNFLEKYLIYLYLNHDSYNRIFYLMASYDINLIPLFPQIDYDFIFYILFKDKLRFKECTCEDNDVNEINNDDKEINNDVNNNINDVNNDVNDVKEINNYVNNNINDVNNDVNNNINNVNNDVNNNINDVNNDINNNNFAFNVNNDVINVNTKTKCIFCELQFNFKKSLQKIHLQSDPEFLKKEFDDSSIIEVSRNLIKKRKKYKFLKMLKLIEKKTAISILKNLSELTRNLRESENNDDNSDNDNYNKLNNYIKVNNKSITMDNFNFSYLDDFGFEFWEFLEIDNSINYLVFLFKKIEKNNFYSLIKILKQKENLEVVDFFKKCYMIVKSEIDNKDEKNKDGKDANNNNKDDKNTNYKNKDEKNTNYKNKDEKNTNDIKDIKDIKENKNLTDNTKNDDEYNKLDKKLQKIILMYLKQNSHDDLIKDFVTSVFMDDKDYFYQVMVFLDKKSLLKYIPLYLTDEGMPYFLKKFEPSELFFESHFLEFEGVNAIKICILNFDEEIIIQVLILLEDKLPVLFMRSVILAYLRFKNKNYTLSLLKRLVKRKIWGLRLYPGFIKCLEVIDIEDCVEVLHELPIDASRELVFKNEKIKKKLIMFLKDNRSNYLENILK
ncbi:putative histone-lysine N-methyltransferase 1, partial [Dictyocoela muelleri]